MVISDYTSPKEILYFKKKIRIVSAGCTGGKKESEGPLADYLDEVFENPLANETSFEKAESILCKTALKKALEKASLTEKNIDILLAGDLLNQCSSSGYGLEDFDIPYVGLYGACSTFAEGLMCAALMIESELITTAAVVASSHFCSAERQFRYPTGYGSFSGPTAQNTVTGAGAFILCSEDKLSVNTGGHPVYITEALPGIVCDRGIQDAGNMGAAMCTAALDTLSRYMDSSKNSFNDFDLVATGDLGWEGNKLLSLLLKDKSPSLKNKLTDCGLLIYDLKKQACGCGGSGCGCSAVVTSGYFYENLKNGSLEKIALVGTGAMMSPKSLLQGLSIPAVAHLVTLTTKPD